MATFSPFNSKPHTSSAPIASVSTTLVDLSPSAPSSAAPQPLSPSTPNSDHSPYPSPLPSGPQTHSPSALQLLNPSASHIQSPTTPQLLSTSSMHYEASGSWSVEEIKVSGSLEPVTQGAKDGEELGDIGARSGSDFSSGAEGMSDGQFQSADDLNSSSMFDDARSPEKMPESGTSSGSSVSPAEPQPRRHSLDNELSPMRHSLEKEQSPVAPYVPLMGRLTKSSPVELGDIGSPWGQEMVRQNFSVVQMQLERERLEAERQRQKAELLRQQSKSREKLISNLEAKIEGLQSRVGFYGQLEVEAEGLRKSLETKDAEQSTLKEQVEVLKSRVNLKDEMVDRLKDELQGAKKEKILQDFIISKERRQMDQRARLQGVEAFDLELGRFKEQIQVPQPWPGTIRPDTPDQES